MKNIPTLKQTTENFITKLRERCYVYNMNRFSMGAKADRDIEYEIFHSDGKNISSEKRIARNTDEVKNAAKFLSSAHVHFFAHMQLHEDASKKEKQIFSRVVAKEIFQWIKEFKMIEIDPIFTDEFQEFQNDLKKLYELTSQPIKFSFYFNDKDEYQKIFKTLLSKKYFEKIDDIKFEYKWIGVSKLQSEPAALFLALSNINLKKTGNHSFSEIARAFKNTFKCEISVSVLQKTDRTIQSDVNTFIEIIKTSTL